MTTRRGFFKLLAGAALAPVASKAAALLPSIPVLYGDGVHDDTEAFQALLDGKVIEFADAGMAEGAGWFGDVLNLPRGIFRVTSTPVMGGSSSHPWRDKIISGNGAKLVVQGGKYGLQIKNAERCNFEDLHINAEGRECGIFVETLSDINFYRPIFWGGLQ